MLKWIDIALVLAVLFLSGILAAVLMLTLSVGLPFGYCIQFGVTVVCALAILEYRGGALKIRGARLSMVLWGTGMVLAVGVLLEPLLSLFPYEYLEDLEWLMNGGVWAVACSVVAAPIAEEVLFRGVFQGSLMKKYGAWGGIFITSVIFGLAHLIPQQMVAATVTGVILGYVYYRTGSLPAVIAIHAANNAFAHLMFYLAGDINATMCDVAGYDIIYFAIYALCALFVVLSVIRIKKLSLQGYE